LWIFDVPVERKRSVSLVNQDEWILLHQQGCWFNPQLLVHVDVTWGDTLNPEVKVMNAPLFI